MKKHFYMLMLVPLCLISCDDNMDKYYEKPDWLEGSIWDLLENDNNYSYFLKGVELTGFRPYLQGKGILTVMAPNDEAFKTYLEKNYGTVDLTTIPKEELSKLIGFHLLYYSYNKANMENFRPEGQGATNEGSEILDPGMYYKFRTRSSSTPTQKIDPNTQKEITVYHLERFIPVFSHNYFKSKKIDARYNYEYFFPNSKWTGEDGFNVSEASVTEYEKIANNGYLYAIDRVLEPMETIYDELKKNIDYSEFLSIYDTYSIYEYDVTLSENYGESIGVDSIYLHKHKDPLPPIAMEWPVSNYLRLDTLAYKSYSVFAPTNKALADMYEKHWANGGYENIKSIDPLILKTLLSGFVYGGSAVFPDEIRTGKITSSLGSVYKFDPDKVNDRKMCVNGSFYGLNEVEAPAVFTSVAGPAFTNKNYSCFLYALDRAGMSGNFSSSVKYTLIIPGNKEFESSGYFLTQNGSENILVEDDGDALVAVSTQVCSDIINIHTIVGEVDFSSTGTQVIQNMVPYNYWYVKDGKITTSDNFNKIIDPSKKNDPFVECTQLTNNGAPWDNGKSYTYDNNNEGLFSTGTDNAGTLQYALSINNDYRYPYYAFVQLLKGADLISDNKITGVSGRFVAFIPTNKAIETALINKKIPGVTADYVDVDNGFFYVTIKDKAVLKTYLYNYLVMASQATTYPYPGSEMKSGEYNNFNQGGMVEFTDTGYSLSVKLKGSDVESKVVDKYNYFPFAYSDGCFHLIDTAF